MTDGCETIAFRCISKGLAEYTATFDQKMTIPEIDVVILERYAQDASSELQQTHLRSRCSLCVACFFARTTAVNPHLSDEKTDSTMLRRWYVSSNSSGFFSCHLNISALGPNPFLWNVVGTASLGFSTFVLAANLIGFLVIVARDLMQTDQPWVVLANAHLAAYGFFLIVMSGVVYFLNQTRHRAQRDGPSATCHSRGCRLRAVLWNHLD